MGATCLLNAFLFLLLLWILSYFALANVCSPLIMAFRRSLAHPNLEFNSGVKFRAHDNYDKYESLFRVSIWVEATACERFKLCSVEWHSKWSHVG